MAITDTVDDHELAPDEVPRCYGCGAPLLRCSICGTPWHPAHACRGAHLEATGCDVMRAMNIAGQTGLAFVVPIVALIRAMTPHADDNRPRDPLELN